MTLEQVISTVDELLEKVKWNRRTDTLLLPRGGEDARGFSGRVDGWFFAVYDYRGPFDDRCCDGAATSEQHGVVFHLTPEQAARAIKLALQQTGGN